MLGIWKIVDYFKSKKRSSMILGSIAIAFAMMGKGPLGLVIPILILSVNMIYNKEKLGIYL